ncbi:DUF3168 domain-containing protein [Serratia sp. M24T3]|uniref:DUF3168 domain-containing protein n=1 Tax=Serratia sp. M24T3 TaxID=932213 RepID=UPI00025BAB17|nr:DUF3168 domain-containing protein [Serratia sp. M24T3]EIC82081.1 hypothetical protein SPM24T3_23632 [Serratia sp. M24T3]
MIAPIFTVCSASAAVTALLGTNLLRIYPFGLKDDAVIYPYAVWQNVGGAPEMYLGTLPDCDSYTIQVDIYADTVPSLQAIAKALRDAIEPHAYITRWGDQDKDPETKRYRYSFDVDWIVTR